ncbi:MAG: serine/threonine-protein kinase [Candidatus Eremiobacteraeota bacterium]|nr:serine/threonine-protein kinase [Candidatus Eremiobacteraeota bacterium]
MGTGFPPGAVIRGRYEVKKLIGRGAFSYVYMAIDRTTGQVWALKEIFLFPLDKGEKKDALLQFEREGQILKSLSHRLLPRIVDIFGEGSRHYMVREFVEGINLNVYMERLGTSLPVSDTLCLAFQVLDILEYLHGRIPPIIFRDLKPSNIIITPSGEAKLIDFGIARFFSPRKDKDTFAMGTPGYAAPEQYGGAQTDGRSDLFSLGATLLYLLTLRDPLLFHFKFPPLHTINNNIPLWLSEAVEKCLKKSPGERYSSAAELRHFLESSMGSAGTDSQ